MVRQIGPGEPLTGFPVLRTRDPGEAEHVVSRAYVAHRLAAADPLDALLNVVRSGPLTIGYLRYGAAARLRVPPMVDVFHVNLTLSGTTAVRQGHGEAQTAGRRSGVVLAPSQPSVVDWSADAGQFALKVERQALEAQLAALLQEPVTRPLRFSLAVDLATPAGRSLLAAVQFLAEQLELLPDGDDLVRQHLESFVLTSLLVGVPHSYRPGLDAVGGPGPRSALAEAIDYIEAHPDRPLGSAELATVVGAPAASLAAAFRSELGTTPEDYVRQVRLARAHAELTAAAGDIGGLRGLARRWGFADDECFAAAYARSYGQDPSAVLRSARVGDGAD
jgi:AraC-like DNA-binding protein